jgi:hypothetical protein
MSCEARHSKQTIENGLHSVISFEYADAAARVTAGPFDAADKYKLAWQIDTEEIYILLDETVPIWAPLSSVGGSSGGDLDLDGYDIINVNLVDGVDVSSHADRHEFGGADQVDGYNIELTYSPSNYDAPVNNRLGEHISAIDDALAGAAFGDVAGPASATDNAVARFDGTTGKLIQNSLVTIDDSGNISTSGTVDGVDVSDHSARHDPGGADALTTAAAVGLNAGSTNAEGAAASFARSNHTHALDVTTGTLSTVNAGDTASDGTAIGLVRRDHQHAVATATASGLTANSTSTEGTSTSLARADHTHAVDSTGTLATVNAGDVASDGTATGFSRKDHQHPVATGSASTLSGSNAEGSSTNLARADHNHALGGTVGGDLSGTLPNPTVVDLTITGEQQGSVLYYSGTNWVQLPPGTDGYVLTTNGAGANPEWGDFNSIGAGDVDGPASATDNAVARFDGTTGKLIQNSLVTIDDSGNISTSGTVDGVDVSDHSSRHDPGGVDALTTAAAVGLNAGSTNAEGVAASFARSNHTHALDVTTGTLSTVNAGDTASDGTAIGLVRRDHQHAVATATASGLTANSTSTEGASTSLARADHTHAIDSTGTLATVNAGDVASDGTATGFSRKDHQHPVATGSASTLSGSNSEGSSTNLARADHNHALGGTVGGDLSGTLPNPTVVDLTITGEQQGSVLYYNGTNWVQLPPGTDGYVLTTNGIGANPEWGDFNSIGAGDVDGPSSATDNAVARFDGTTGKLIQNSLVTIDDSGNISTSGTVDGVDVSDHSARHDPGGADALTTAAAVGLNAGSTNTEGAATSFARSNHTHAIDVTTGTLSTINAGDTASDGTAIGLVRRDHQHAVATATASGLTANSTSTEGTSTSLARADHTHAIDSTGTLSAVNAGDTSSDGTATGFSRKDHQHGVATATAVAVGTANAEGSSTSLARADHTHQVTGLTIASQTQGSILYYNGSSWVVLAPGTDGYALITNGVGQNPEWGQVASTGLNPPLNPSEDGYVAIGLAGNLDYIGGLVDGYVLTWDGDSWGAEILPRRRVTVEFTLTEDVNNTTEWFTTWRSHGGDSPSSKRSGNNSGIQNQNACSPYQVPFDAKIIKAIMTLKGAGVQNGSVTYPVTYQTDLYDEGFTSESKIADIDFSISNSFTVGTYSVGSTNYKGSVNLDINVSEAQLLALKFINGVSASLVGQTRNAFVTLILEER